MSRSIGYIPGENDNEEAHVHPTEKAKLLLEIPLLQRHDKAHEADDIKGEADHAMVGCEWRKLGVGEDNMLQGSTIENQVSGPILE